MQLEPLPAAVDRQCVRSVILVALLCGFAIASAVWSQTPEASVGGFEGVWKMCYSPGLEGIVEIDDGYLVLMPEGRFYEVGESCCFDEEFDPKPPYWEANSYRIEGRSVILTRAGYLGKTREDRLELKEQVPSVLFDAPDAKPKARDALSGGGKDINYGYCRVYPVWPVQDAPHDNPTEQAGAVHQNLN